MMYDATSDKKKLKDSRLKLDNLYSRIPETKGCMENNSKPESEGGCGAWCCKLQSPQVLYVEFLNSWNTISHEWTDAQIENLIERSIRKYLFPNKDRGCVFLDRESNLCSQHETRPYNCRVYGIIPEEEFKPRYERLKIIYPETRNQCDLVSTQAGHKVTETETTNWWLELNGIEMFIGIKQETISDAPGGSYRTYHDHILIHMLGEQGIIQLSELRKNGSPNEKEHTIKRVMDALRKFKEKKVNGNSKENAPSEESKDTGK